LLTLDDTMTSLMARQNISGPPQPGKHPFRNILTQSAGQRDELDVHLREEKIEPDDLFLLCSDGLHGVVPDDSISSILSAGGVGADAELETMTQQLIGAAQAAGAPDNVSVILVRCLV
jgi:serine/threonine protein phosphatase PrpC